MAHGYKGEIPFHKLCSLIYEGFGMWAVIALVEERQANGLLRDIEWDECADCDTRTPFDKGNWMMTNTRYCLVCGLTHKEEEE